MPASSEKYGLPLPEGTDSANLMEVLSNLVEGDGSRPGLETIIDLLAPPVGVPLPFMGGAVPDGYLLLDGSAVSRTTYAKLFEVCGTAFGAGNGSTTFNLPDLRGRVPIGADLGAGRVTSQNARGQSSGEQTHTLATGQIPSHVHSGPSHTHGAGTLITGNAGEHSHSAGGLDTGNAGGHSHGSGSLSTGNAGAHTHRGRFVSDGQISGGGSISFLRPWGAGGSISSAPLESDGSHSHSVSGSTATVSAHSHSITGNTGVQSAHSHPISGATAAGGTANTGASGGGGAHNNMQPYQVFNWITRTGIMP